MNSFFRSLDRMVELSFCLAIGVIGVVLVIEAFFLAIAPADSGFAGPGAFLIGFGLLVLSAIWLRSFLRRRTLRLQKRGQLWVRSS